MAFWLLKSEPDVFSMDDLQREGSTFWSGVRSFAPRNFLRDDMRPGDLGFFYHSNAKPSGVAGVVRIASRGKPDPTQFDKKLGLEMGFDPKSKRESPTWFGVDVEFVEKWDGLVPLSAIKANPKLAQMKLLKISRLSVCPVSAAEWKIVLSMRQ